MLNNIFAEGRSMRIIGRLITVLVLASTSFAFAQEHGRLAVHSQINPFTIADLFGSVGGSSTPAFDPGCKIGLRFYLTDRLGLDLYEGIVYNSGNKRDSISGTEASPEYRNFKTDIGFVYEAAKGDHAALGFLGQVGLSFQRWHDYTYIGSTYSPLYSYYNVMVPSVFVGFEPSYSPSPNFSFFSTFGASLIFIPNSKHVAGTTTGLLAQKDASTSFVTNGCTIGMRYHF